MGDDSIQSPIDIERIAAEASGKSRNDAVAKSGHQERVRRDGTPPEEGETVGDFNIRIGRDGTWYYRGSPIHRLPLVKLFSTVLRREADGSHWMVTPVERGRILVEDAAFVAVDMDVTEANGLQTLMFRTNLDETVAAGPDHPIRVDLDPETGEPCPYVMVRDGLEALIARAVYYRLVERAEEVASPDGGSVRLEIESGGARFSLGAVPAEVLE